MTIMDFEWDDAKADINEQKHGVSFKEAVTVFDDPLSELLDDVRHSGQEERLILMGESDAQRLLVVSFTERPNATRIISARLATKGEARRYGA
jgi:uncharacterized DUF497 family protein